MFRGWRSMPGQVTRRGKAFRGVHIIDTEARTLEDACQVISARQTKARQSAAAKNRARTPPTLKQEFAISKGMAALREYRRRMKPKERLPHPFKDLPEDEKIEKAREMYASGMWGFGTLSLYQLSRVFGVEKEVFVEWIDGITPKL